jgi:hypothetical protein
MKNMTSMVIPEGAWVTAFWTPAVDLSGQSGICSSSDVDVPNDFKVVLQMGVAKELLVDGTVQVTGYATGYVMDTDTGIMLAIPGSGTTPMGSPTAYGIIVGDSTAMADGTMGCTFSGLDKVWVVSNNLPTAVEGGYYKAFTFGFMPGYYSATKCQTAHGECNST